VARDAAAKPAQAFLERNVNAPDEAMALIDIEDENAIAGTAGLRGVRSAHVEIAL
jgi:hypothetical protein